MGTYWLNTDTYTNPELVLFGVGAIFWVLCYAIVIKDILKYKFVGISAGVIGANIAWEFLWAFVFKQDMGMILQIGYYAWFFADVFIVYSTFKYGYKQVGEKLHSRFNLLFGFSIGAWLVVLYFFIHDGYDNSIGANTAYAIQLVISITCLIMLINNLKEKGISYWAAWCRMLGSLLCGIMCIMHWPENHWILSMVVIYMMIDVYYIILATKNRIMLKIIN